MKSPLAETENLKYNNFHWLSYGSLPLAELVLGKEEFFSSSSRGSKIVLLPVRDANYISSYWSQ